MRYTQLRAFHNVALHGGFSRAAAALGYGGVAPFAALALAFAFGPDAAAEIAKEAYETGKTIREVCLARKVLPASQLDQLLDAEQADALASSLPTGFPVQQGVQHGGHPFGQRRVIVAPFQHHRRPRRAGPATWAKAPSARRGGWAGAAPRGRGRNSTRVNQFSTLCALPINHG